VTPSLKIETFAKKDIIRFNPRCQCPDVPGAGDTSGTRPPRSAPLLYRAGLVPDGPVPHRRISAPQRLSVQIRRVRVPFQNIWRVRERRGNV